MTKSNKASELDWLKNYTETLNHAISCGYDKKTAMEISNLIVRARRDIEPNTGRRAALAANITACKTPAGHIKVAVDVDLRLVPKELRKKLRRHPNVRK